MQDTPLQSLKHISKTLNQIQYAYKQTLDLFLTQLEDAPEVNPMVKEFIKEYVQHTPNLEHLHLFIAMELGNAQVGKTKIAKPFQEKCFDWSDFENQAQLEFVTRKPYSNKLMVKRLVYRFNKQKNYTLTDIFVESTDKLGDLA